MPPPPPTSIGYGRPPASGGYGRPPAPASGIPPRAYGQPPAPAGAPASAGIPPRPASAGRPASTGRPVAPPPPKYRPEPKPQKSVKRRVELGEDPAKLAERKAEERRPWLVWILSGVAALTAVSLVVALFMNLNAPTQPPAPTSSAANPQASGTPQSTWATSSPQTVAAGSLVPITVDAKFEPGITFVGPTPGGRWVQDTSGQTRDPNSVQIYDSATHEQILFTHSTMDSKRYTDEDLTRSSLETAYQGFVDEPEMEGEPFVWVLKGKDGTQLELLAQKMTWWDGTEAFVLTRLMPQSDARIEITVIAKPGAFDDPNSAISRKLSEITFTVP
ncbi:hypothetical protein USB125703_00905 [Pseudoclavibacter triregionum]|nr:hypothetical protein USB125703_00905 [Pseudoclavibacter triregionum]